MVLQLNVLMYPTIHIVIHTGPSTTTNNGLCDVICICSTIADTVPYANLLAVVLLVDVLLLLMIISTEVSHYKSSYIRKWIVYNFVYVSRI